MTIGPFPLEAREGVTIAVGLTPGVVTQAALRVPSPLFDFGPLILGGAAVLLGAGAAVVGALARRRTNRGRGTVIAQYDVPAALPPVLAAPVAGASSRAAAAEIVHLAVHGALEIVDGDRKPGLFGLGAPQLQLRLTSPERVGDPLDAEMVTALFPQPTPGTLIEIPKNNSGFAKRITRVVDRGTTAATERGYFAKQHDPLARRLGGGALWLAGGLILFIIIGAVVRGFSDSLAIGIILAILAAALGVFAAVAHRVYTEVGTQWRDYLAGVKLFITVAEADRLRVLQSYSGAERRADGELNIVKIYEHLLPYAVLFGCEREWGKVLEVRYREQAAGMPLWYPGLTAAGLSQLGSSISSFTSSLQSSASYTSSSSGGSSGGGFAGGGGGGGFSGGR